MKKTNKDSVFKINSKSAYIEHRLRNPIISSHVEVDFRIKNNFLRRVVSKSFINIYLSVGESKEFNLSGVYISDLMYSNRYQKAWIGFAAASPSEARILPINAVRISVDTKKPYLLPGTIEIKEIKLLLEKTED